MRILIKVWKFTKAPVYQRLEHIPLPLKIKILTALLLWGILIGIGFGIFNEWFFQVLGIELGEHAIENFLEKHSVVGLFLIIVVLAPVLEELLFRGPLIWFRNKSYFKYILYASIILFAAVHLSNFEGSKKVLYIAPLLVAPQLILGVFLGYIRVKLGLHWSIYLHATFNCILITPVLIGEFLNIPLE